MKNYWTGALALLGLAAIMTPAILLAASGSESGFDAVVHEVESRYHTHAHRIPFLGLISAVAGVSTHGGVHNLHLAEFEHLDRPINGEDLNAIVERHVGQGWQRIVRETSRGGDEQSLIFVHPEGNHLGMLVVDLQGSELDLVQISINPDQLTHELSERSGRHHHLTADEEKPGEGTPDQPSHAADTTAPALE